MADTNATRDGDRASDGATSTEELVQRVIIRVANETGTDPESLPPISRSIDPDVVNEFGDGDRSKTLSFEYDGYEVTVTGDGTVRLRPLV